MSRQDVSFEIDAIGFRRFRSRAPTMTRRLVSCQAEALSYSVPVTAVQ